MAVAVAAAVMIEAVGSSRRGSGGDVGDGGDRAGRWRQPGASARTGGWVGAAALPTAQSQGGTRRPWTARGGARPPPTRMCGPSSGCASAQRGCAPHRAHLLTCSTLAHERRTHTHVDPHPLKEPRARGVSRWNEVEHRAPSRMHVGNAGEGDRPSVRHSTVPLPGCTRGMEVGREAAFSGVRRVRSWWRAHTPWRETPRRPDGNNHQTPGHQQPHGRARSRRRQPPPMSSW